MEKAQAKQQGVDLKSFVMIQNGQMKAVKDTMDRLFNDFAANLQNAVQANENLAKENEELKNKINPVEPVAKD